MLEDGVKIIVFRLYEIENEIKKRKRKREKAGDSGGRKIFLFQLNSPRGAPGLLLMKLYYSC